MWPLLLNLLPLFVTKDKRKINHYKKNSTQCLFSKELRLIDSSIPWMVSVAFQAFSSCKKTNPNINGGKYPQKEKLNPKEKKKSLHKIDKYFLSLLPKKKNFYNWMESSKLHKKVNK